jgi:hypothetical protein
VLGDATSASKMPKSAHATNSQAKVAAAAIVVRFRGQAPGEAAYVNTCYSILGHDFGNSVAGIDAFDAATDLILEVPGSGGVSPIDASPELRRREESNAHSRCRNVIDDMLERPRETSSRRRRRPALRRLRPRCLHGPGPASGPGLQPQDEEMRAMSDTPTNKRRRDAVRILLGGLATVPLVHLVGLAAAQASELPRVDEATDPTAIALKYKHDATQADRAGANRPGLPPEEQDCTNCQFVLGEGEWVGCTLFPGKSVAAKGWCISWTPKPAA